MGGIVHFHIYTSVVILVVHGLGVFSRKPKCQPPASAHLYGPPATLVSFQWMKIQARQAHIAWLRRHIQSAQDQAESLRVLRLDSGFDTRPKKPLQPLVPKASDRHS
jgi:hypothetical protein